MLSYRGLLSLVIGLFFILFAIFPDAFSDASPPWPIVVVMLVTGTGMLVMGILSIRFVWMRNAILKTTDPIDADVCILARGDSEEGAYTVHVLLSGQCWAIGVDSCRVVVANANGDIRSGRVWVEPTSRKPVAIEVNGRQLNTLLGGRPIRADQFGKED